MSVVRIAVRGYELDSDGHLNPATYFNYAEHARWECRQPAGINGDALVASRIGPGDAGGDDLDLDQELLVPDPRRWTTAPELLGLSRAPHAAAPGRHGGDEAEGGG
jgi:hypothetical protein